MSNEIPKGWDDSSFEVKPENNPEGMSQFCVKSYHPFGIDKTIPKPIIVSLLRSFFLRDYE